MVLDPLTSARDGVYIDHRYIVNRTTGDRMAARHPNSGGSPNRRCSILASLSDGPKHGYAIMDDIEAGTGRPMGAGHPLRRPRPARGGGPRRSSRAGRPAPAYRLTAVGATTLAEQLRGLIGFARRACGSLASPSHEVAADPLLPGPMARALRRRVRGAPRGAAARTVRRCGRPSRRPRRAPS